MSKQGEWRLVGELTDEPIPEGEIVFRLTAASQLGRVLRQSLKKQLEGIFKPVTYKRSDAQNRGYWLYVNLIRSFEKERTGKKPTQDAVHAYNLVHVIGRTPVVQEIAGKNVVVIEGKTTSEMNTVEFGEFIDVLQQHWAEKGCVLPELKKDNFLHEFVDD